MEVFGDYHTHSKNSDGRQTVGEIVRAARQKGLHEVAITDHGPLAAVIGVKDAAVYLKLRQVINQMDSQKDGTKVLLGAEANIRDRNGCLDIPAEVIEELDILIVGLHPYTLPTSIDEGIGLFVQNSLRHLGKSQQEKAINANTEAVIEALHHNPGIDILSHPGLFFTVDVAEVARACMKNKVLFEINCGHEYPPISDIIKAEKTGVNFIINSDAHFPDTVGNLEYGLQVVRKAGIDEERVVNLNARRGVFGVGQKSTGLQLLIITGMSGAGKTQVINCLEDMDYYCVDNLPPTLLTKFIELGLQSEGKVSKVALVIDVRGGEFFRDMSTALDELVERGIPYEILFLEASDEVLIRRFKESRRRHPLTTSGRLLDSIRLERSMLEELRGKANLVIDTSGLSPRELKEKLTSMYTERQSGGFSVNVVSFGYKMGIPLDSDIVIDVRFLPNPFYDPVMRTMTGEDRPVIDYVLESTITRSFTRRFLNLLRFLIPHYIKEGKTNLSLSVGCTGGQHRSVVLTDYIGRQLKNMGYYVIVKHRDISKYKNEE